MGKLCTETPWARILNKQVLKYLMSFAFAEYLPGKPVGDESNVFEMRQEYYRCNPEGHIQTPLEQMYDPGDEFYDQFLEVEMTAPDIETRLKAQTIREIGQYLHLPQSMEELRQRNVDELIVTEEAAAEVAAAFERVKRSTIERDQRAQQAQHVE
jgi:hypothetical protein